MIGSAAGVAFMGMEKAPADGPRCAAAGGKTAVMPLRLRRYPSAGMSAVWHLLLLRVLRKQRGEWQ